MKTISITQIKKLGENQLRKELEELKNTKEMFQNRLTDVNTTREELTNELRNAKIMIEKLSTRLLELENVNTNRHKTNHTRHNNAKGIRDAMAQL